MKGANCMIYCCEEHVDIALDNIVDQFETAPKLTKVSEVPGVDNREQTCGYCEKPAIYIVANE